MRIPITREAVLFVFILFTLLLSSGIALSQPQPVCLWTFDDPADLTRASIGGPLNLVGEHTAVSGIEGPDGAVRIGAGSYYIARHGITPNGGNYVNQYSLVFDFKVPEIGAWFCFYNTSDSNANDGDGWINKTGNIGVGATGYSDYAISPGEWYRLSIVIDLVAGNIEYFINGDSIHQGTGQDVDGRFSIYGSDSSTPYILLFADNDNEGQLMDVSMVSIYDKPLTPAEISSLGGPQPVSEMKTLGDVTGDLVVDGRDALKILRDSKGLETIPAENREAGDVFPFPGLNGKHIGDDALTSDDAQKILNYSVGLISADELTGNLNKLSPRIDDVLPGRAGIGVLVVLEGINFLVGEAENPKVFFNDLEAEVLDVSNAEISVKVPEGAINGPIKVETVIGTARTSDDFIIIPKTDGLLDLGDGLNPEDFIVVGLDETVSDANGSFRLTMLPDVVSLIGAVPKGDGDNSFLAVSIPGYTDQPDQPFIINAETTAKALVFMHPFFMSRETHVAKWLMTLMEDLPELDELTAVISQRYPQGANGLEDAEVESAWAKAVAALADAIPETVSFSVEHVLQAAKNSRSERIQNSATAMKKAKYSDQQPLVVMQSDEEPKIRTFNPDREYLALQYDEESKGFEIYIYDDNYCPVDWIARIYRIDPVNFPLGWNTPSSEIVMTGYPHMNYQETIIIPAKQWTALIDLVREGFNRVFDGLVSGSTLRLQTDPNNANLLDDEAVYLVRCFNGAFREHGAQYWDTNAVQPGHKELYNQHLKARAMNVMLILVDVWGLFTNETDVYKKAAISAVQNNTATLIPKMMALDGVDISKARALDLFLNVLKDASKGIAQSFSEHGLSIAKEKVQGQLKSILTSSTLILDALSKASTIGRIFERGFGLNGQAFGAEWDDMDYGVTPLETFQIVVGDPFSPIVESFSPESAYQDSIVTITGKRFHTTETNVYISTKGYVDFKHDLDLATKLEIVEATEKQLKVKIPSGLDPTAKYKFVVRTPASSGDSGDVNRNYRSYSGDFTYLPTPKIWSALPDHVFSKVDNEVFPDFEGTLVTIEGINLLLDASDEYVYFKDGDGESLGTIIERSDSKLIVRVPPGLKPGETELYLKNPGELSIENEWKTTEPIPFTVIAKPVIDADNQTEAKSGEYVTIKGKNFQEAICLLDDVFIDSERISETGIRFGMPVGDESEVLTLVIWNPSGPSGEWPIKRGPGIEFTPPQTNAATVTVYIFPNPESYQVSLSEAAQFSRGELNLIPIDDDNLESIIEYNDSPLGYRIISSKKLPPNKYPHEKEVRYCYTKNVDDSLSFQFTESLDGPELGEENPSSASDLPEKADYVFVTGEYFDRDAYNGEDNFELISPNSDEKGTFQIGNLHIGQGDVLDMKGADLSMNSITFEDNCTYTFENVTSSSQITLDKNNVIIKAGTFNNLNEPILIENSLGNLFENITIENPANGGLLIRGGGGNTVRALISDSQTYGVRLENSQENTLYIHIDNCPDYGMNVVEGHGNVLDLRIVDSGSITQTGVILESTQNNELLCEAANCDTGIELISSIGNSINTVGAISECKYGLMLRNSELNEMRGAYTANEAGIYVDDYCVGNIFMTILFGNVTGMILEGENTHSNTLKYSSFGKYVNWETGAYDVLGNQEYGLHIRNGANNNIVDDCEFYDNGNHAIYIEGENTHSNVIRDSHFGPSYNGGEYLEDKSYGNKGDGIRIDNGANQNKLIDVYIGQSQGNGITISGAKTDYNEILSSGGLTKTRIGSQINVINEGPPYPNKGWGIAVQDGAFGTVIKDVVLGVNELGGLLVNGIKGTLSEEKSLTVKYLSVGYTSDGDQVHTQPFTETFGNGIQIEDSSQLSFTDCDVAYHDKGLVISGENSNHISIYDLEILQSKDCGLMIEGGNQFELNTIITSHNLSNGMVFKNTSNVEMSGMMGTSQSNQGHGILIDSCEHTTMNSMQIGPNNTGDGIHIINSYNTIMNNMRHYQNQGNGLFVGEGSLDTTFYSGEALENALNGFSLDECTNFWLYGIDHAEGLFVYGNGLHAVQMNNSKNIYIGKNNRGGYFCGEDYPAILIQGYETNNVQITANAISGQQGATAVHVTGGKNVVIGSPERGEGNNFTFNTDEGILAEGADTRVEIVGNLIGDYTDSNETSNGNEIGIVLQKNIRNAKITKNTINANRSYGILLRDGANRNEIVDNVISRNGKHAIRIEGGSTLGNRISNNSIYQNEESGINISEDAKKVASPTVKKIDTAKGMISGICMAPADSIIQVFADRGNQGRYFVGSSRLLGNEFVVYGDIPSGYKLNAIAIDPEHNMSEFGLMELLDDTGEQDSYVYTHSNESNKDIYLKDPTLSEHIQLTKDAADDYSPRFSSTGSQVLFVSERSGNSDLWLMNNNGSNPQQITDNPSPDYDPNWIGNSVIYISERDGNPEIYTQPAAMISGSGGGEISYSDQEPDYGYDFAAKDEAIGQQFTAPAPGKLNRLGFYIVGGLAEFGWKILNWDGGKPGETVLAEGAATPTEIGWNYFDIEEVSVPADFVVALYFLSDSKPAPGLVITGSKKRTWHFDKVEWIKGYNILLFKAFLKASSATRLTNTDSTERYPAASPDQSKIAFASDREGSMDIWIMDVDGSNPIRLTQGEGINTKPSWSPDGKQIAFVSSRSGNEDIFVMDADGQNLKQLTDSPAINTDPVWHERGNRILFSSDRDDGMELYIIDLASLNVIRLTDSDGDSTQPDSGPELLPQTAAKVLAVGKGNQIYQLEGGASLSIQSGETKPGETIVLSVDLLDAENLGNLEFDINYDDGILQLIELPMGAVTQDGLYAHNPLHYPSDLDLVRFNWIRAEGFTGNGNVMQLAFQVDQNAQQGEYPIEFKNSNAYDIGLNEIPIYHLDGILTVWAPETKVNQWMLFN